MCADDLREHKYQILMELWLLMVLKLILYLQGCVGNLPRAIFNSRGVIQN